MIFRGDVYEHWNNWQLVAEGKVITIVLSTTKIPTADYLLNGI